MKKMTMLATVLFVSFLPSLSTATASAPASAPLDQQLKLMQIALSNPDVKSLLDDLKRTRQLDKIRLVDVSDGGGAVDLLIGELAFILTPENRSDSKECGFLVGILKGSGDPSVDVHANTCQAQ